MSLLLEWKILGQAAESQERTQTEKSRCRKRFSENVGDVVIGVDIGKVNGGIVNTFANIMPAGCCHWC